MSRRARALTAGDEGAQRRHRHVDARGARPAVVGKAPGLGDEHAPRRLLHRFARRRHERGNERVVGIVLNTQEGFRLGERKRLARRRFEEDRGHDSTFGS